MWVTQVNDNLFVDPMAVSLVGSLVVTVILKLPAVKNALPPNGTTLLGFLSAWVLVGVLIFITIRVERRSLASIGLKSITGKEVLLAIAVGIGLALSVPLLTWLVSQIIPATEQGSIAAVTKSIPVSLLLFGVITASVTEEILYRGYPIERILEVGGSRWIALLIPVIAFVLPHMFGWNFTHLIAVVLPLGFVLSALYL